MTCPFCARIQAGDVERRWPDAVAFTPHHPVRAGRHMLIVPVEHAADAGADPEGAAAALRRAAEWAAESGLPFNVITSAGEAATQTVLHTHLHVVLREPGDGLTLPWTGQKR